MKTSRARSSLKDPEALSSKRKSLTKKIDGWIVKKHANLWEDPEPLEVGCSFSCRFLQISGQSTGAERGNESLKKKFTLSILNYHRNYIYIVFN